jgi:hypothetical protein
MDSPARMTPRSQISSPAGGRPRSNFGGSQISAASGASAFSSIKSARAFAQRESSTLLEDMFCSEREASWDARPHLVRRQQPWSSAQHGVQVAWSTHTSFDRLNWDLDPHPSWIAKAPGTYASTFERNLAYDYAPTPWRSPAPYGSSPFRAPPARLPRVRRKRRCARALPPDAHRAAPWAHARCLPQGR